MARIFWGVFAFAVMVAVLVFTGVTAPVSAQQAVAGQSAQNGQNLPQTLFSAEDGTAAPAGHGFAAPPGFAHAPVAVNPNHPEATPIGQQMCMGCHVLEAEHFAHTVHSLGMNVALAADPNTATCEACHGGGSAHAADPFTPGTILAFTKGGGTPITAQTESCLGCHAGGPRDAWTGSVHQRNDLSCSDCHNPMAKFASEGLMARQSISETCATCHRDIRQQFNRRSHMPLPEGLISCDDCHNPHGTLNHTLLKTDTVNETCYQCHAEKRGPFLFEHAPVKDGCLNCHTVHGSNQHALLVAPLPMLCHQCHTHQNHPNDLMTSDALMSGTRPDWRLMGRACINCHAQIHGSNSPSGPRFHQ